jgi:hypothetical protein
LLRERAEGVDAGKATKALCAGLDKKGAGKPRPLSSLEGRYWTTPEVIAGIVPI